MGDFVMRLAGRDCDGSTSKCHSTLDSNTMKWQSWVSHMNPLYPLSQSGQIHLQTYPDVSASDGPQQKSKGNHEYLNQLTKQEFRRLSDQLKDVNWNLGNRFKGLRFNRFKAPSGEDSAMNDKSVSLYRSQLAINNEVFNPSMQAWRPYTNPSEPAYTRCKPVCHQIPHREKQPRVAYPENTRRPKSSDITNSRSANQVSWGDYDMLNAEIINDFTNPAQEVNSKYGERFIITGKDPKGECHIVIEKHESLESRAGTCAAQVSCSLQSDSSTSGIISDNEDSNSNHSDSNSTNNENKAENCTARIDSSIQLVKELEQPASAADEDAAGGAADYDEDKSDDDRIPEPEIPSIKARKIPKAGWCLKPDSLDDLTLLDGLADRSRYNFDAHMLKQPKYEFASVFSKELMAVDLRNIAEQEASLHLKPKVNQVESSLIMRCLELEKLQLVTEKSEDTKYNKMRQVNKLQRAYSKPQSRSRAQSARSSRPSSSRCTADCLQTVCVGDCVAKQFTEFHSCIHCNKDGCTGINCSSIPYTNHMRKVRREASANETDSISRKPRPKSCSSCSKATNPADTINSQSVSLGRPKSNHITYSQAKKVVYPPAKKPIKQSYHLQRISPQFDPDGSENYPTRPMSSPGRVSSARTRRGRDAVAPHKSYYSQRRISLTANTYRPVYGVNLPTKRRAQSAKYRLSTITLTTER